MPHRPQPANLRREVTAATSACSERLNELLERNYDSLHAIAKAMFAREAKHHHLQPTELIGEAYLKLVDQSVVSARGPTFFRRCFARQCRHLLVEHARRRQRLRHGGGIAIERLSMVAAAGITGELGILEVHDALEALTKFHPRGARIAELRLFAGLDITDIANLEQLGERTVEHDWMLAKIHLRRILGRD